MWKGPPGAGLFFGGQLISLFQNVIPAKAGIQRLQTFSHERPWIPAFAGMTT